MTSEFRAQLQGTESRSKVLYEQFSKLVYCKVHGYMMRA